MASIASLAVRLSTVLPMEEKPSLISLQIQMMEKKGEELQKKFETLRFLSQAEVEKTVSDAKDLLAHYEYAISELMKPYASRDPSLMYFNELSCRILIEENPTSEEIARCEEILGQIKRCGLDLREAQDLISYRGAADEIEEVLQAAADEGYDYCVTLAAGCMIKDFNFTQKVLNFINEGSFGVAGHPLYHPGRWLELHSQFFIVNIKAWLDVGRPNFGTWLSQEHMLPVVKRSELNFHHDYTPIWVKPTGEQRLQTGAGQGWELMTAMFNNNYEVVTLPQDIRLNKFYAYPEHETQKFEDSIKTFTSYPDQNWNQDKLINDAKMVKDQIWLFNSENLVFDNDGKFDLVVNTASGFKILDLFKRPRLNPNAIIKVYDFNPISLAWYKYFYTYPSENLLECIRSFEQRNNFTWIGQSDATRTGHLISVLKKTLTFLVEKLISTNTGNSSKILKSSS